MKIGKKKNNKMRFKNPFKKDNGKKMKFLFLKKNGKLSIQK